MANNRSKTERRPRLHNFSELHYQMEKLINENSTHLKMAGGEFYGEVLSLIWAADSFEEKNCTNNSNTNRSPKK